MTDPAFLLHYDAVTDAEASRREHQPEFSAWLRECADRDETGQRDTAKAGANGDGILTDTTTSAVERLAVRFDGYRGDCISQRTAATLRALAAERDRLREALALFADDESWKRDRACDPNSACFVGQAVARAAMEATNE